jgi:hypothetical protein
MCRTHEILRYAQDDKKKQMKKPLLTALTPLLLRHRAEAEAAGLPALMAAAERAVTTLYHGDHRQRRSGSGERFWQFREYDPGDRPQDIDWRQSAKSDRVFVRQKEWQTAQNILFWVQNDRGMALKTGRSEHTKHEAAIILSLALGILLTRAGERIGPLQESNRTGRNDLALQYLGETLCRRNPALPPGPELPALNKVPGQSSLIFVGDFMQKPDAIEKTLHHYAAQAPHGLLIQTLDPAEVELPFNGRVIFRPFDDSKDIPISSVPSIRKTYSDRLRAHIDEIRSIARHHGYGHVLHITSDDPRLSLSEAWQLLAPQPRLAAGG